jgi:uncharacterized spore protein YtfJ
MPSSVEALIERVMGELHRIVRTETVVGEPVIAGEVTLIPVSKISFGFGAGSSPEGKGPNGAGTGGGATVEPIAFVVIDAQGKTQILPLKEQDINLGSMFKYMPEAMAKIKDFVGKRKETASTEKPSTEGDSDQST